MPPEQFDHTALRMKCLWEVKVCKSSPVATSQVRASQSKDAVSTELPHGEKQAKKEAKVLKKAAEERKKKLQESLKKRAEEKAKVVEDKKKALEKAAAEKKKKEAAEKKKADKEAAAKAKAESGVVDLDDEAVEEIDEEEAKEDEDEEMKEDLVKEEEVKEEEKEETKEESEEESEEPAEVEEADPEPPVAELTADEKKVVFKPCATPDVTAATLNGGFAKYSFPDKSEGFDEIKFEWANEKKSAEHLAAWGTQKKITARIDDLVPGEWFDSKQKEWAKFVAACKQKQNDYKAAVAKRASDKAAKEKVKQMKALQKKKKIADEEAKKKAKAVAKEKADLAKAAAKEAKAAAKEKAAQERAEKIEKGEEVPEEPAEEVEEEEAEPMEEVEEEKAEEEEEPEEPVSEDEDLDLDAIDVFGVEDIFKIGGKPVQPIFAHFGFEDWALMGLRFELNLLVHAFKKDVKEAERALIHEDNIGFYYQKYYKKGLSPTFFGVKTSKELVDFFEDTLTITSQRVLETHLPCDFEALNVFVLLGETARRDRARRLDLGEEGAKIKMTGVGVTPVLGAAKTFGVSSGQMGAIANLQAQRTAFQGAAVRPYVAVQRPSFVQAGQVARPPAYYGAPAQPLWRPQGVGVSPGAWGPRPVSPWGAPGMVRPYGMVRPAAW